MRTSVDKDFPRNAFIKSTCPAEESRVTRNIRIWRHVYDKTNHRRHSNGLAGPTYIHLIHTCPPTHARTTIPKWPFHPNMETKTPQSLRAISVTSIPDNPQTKKTHTWVFRSRVARARRQKRSPPLYFSLLAFSLLPVNRWDCFSIFFLIKLLGFSESLPIPLIRSLFSRVSSISSLDFGFLVKISVWLVGK